MRVIHAGARDAAAKGKIEAFFRGTRSRFLDALRLEGMRGDLEALNRAFRAWVETHYNGATHSAHGSTPIRRWIEGARRLRTINVPEADELFLFETERTVKKDGTISLDARRFETDSALVGKRVLVRYDPQLHSNYISFSSHPRFRRVSVNTSKRPSDINRESRMVV